MSFRQYSVDLDDLYSPDATPSLFLSEEQVEESLNSVPQYSEEPEKEARSVVVEIEALNRQEKAGLISADKSLSRNRAIAEQFLEKYGFFPYVTRTYQQFYEYFAR